MESKINRITDILRRDDGISGAMMYTEQISWILFLKFINDLEINKAEEAELDGENTRISLMRSTVGMFGLVLRITKGR